MASRGGGAHAALPPGALQAPSATELRLAARRAIAALRKAPRATAERALGRGENDENEENMPALEQLALYHLRQIAAELEDEVRAFLSTGRVRPSGVASFLLPEDGKDEQGREAALEEMMEGERVAAEQRSGALRALERQPRPRTSSGGADAARQLNDTFVMGGGGAPPGIPRIADFDGIREYSDNVSARDIRVPFPAALKRVVIVEEEQERIPWREEEEDVINISAREEAMDEQLVARVVEELRAELVADRSFVATFRSGDMASTARAIERRLRARRREECSFDIAPGGEDKEEEEEEGRGQRSPRDQRSAARRYSMPPPLLESTPLKTRGSSQRPTGPPSARRRILEDPPERVTIGVGTSARDLPEEGGYGSREERLLQSTGVQCELEDPSSISSHSRGALPSEESSSFGQVPDRLLLQSQLQLRVVQQPPTPAARSTAPSPSVGRVVAAASLSSPDSLMRGLLQEETRGAPPAPPPRPSLMYPSSDEEEREEEEAENTLENLESLVIDLT